ncbi:MAG TPA: EamA family transporter [Xanthobacteraceae bacterium]|nr:EamA family transporter [Xanthobacteraceae bacterium]
MTHPHNKLGLALGVAGVVLFAGTLPATRFTVATIDPLFLTAARGAIAGIAGLIALTLLRRPLPPRPLWREIFLGGSCTVVGFPMLTALAMVSVPAAHGGVGSVSCRSPRPAPPRLSPTRGRAPVSGLPVWLGRQS